MVRATDTKNGEAHVPTSTPLSTHSETPTTGRPSPAKDLLEDKPLFTMSRGQDPRQFANFCNPCIHCLLDLGLS
jgi:hypothetical protein